MDKKMIITDKNQRELKQMLDGKFPIAVERISLSSYAGGYFGHHWHPELEFEAVTEGPLEYQVNGHVFELHAGEGIFINSNTLHWARNLGEGGGGFQTLRFSPSLLGGISGSLIYEMYIHSILANDRLAYLKLSPDVKWQKKIIRLITDTVEVDRLRREGYRLEILSNLFGIWNMLYSNAAHMARDSDRQVLNMERIKKSIAYIEHNYQNQITLDEIAGASAISKSECCRMFRRYLRQSPMNYVISYRINQSISLIAENKYSMTEVAQQVGISNSSYFTKTFIKMTGMTPSQYRRNVLKIQ
ncbi:putative HTH-type transcriptional regulator YdeC [Lachnospiraceae bacterium]|uniref:AraC family transcriptional regulator n=1 Tax=Extibacter sp. GGCC_0201 TaxID=2731209 RepID=UPI001AA178E7|nr:helix-turn-helix domain-containing protein [Extibacter sp. GGCC_0201]MBO1720419.1 AraC family transcriptional regulator [Extibacter sp. GGCC_0201]BDF34521.1 putative HTH-type transcriptional regulator YdeC [Lachnospiraceae bacterium]BDF38523.1 putative HTH-type transcriptional regulator YdeC [Lachnospiraceae bacterium]